MADEVPEAAPEVVTERRGSVLILRINRPEARNALNGAVMAGLGRGILDAETDPDIRAIVLTGTGDRAFCAGMDLRSFASGGMPGGADDGAAMAAFTRFMREGADTPVIGAANANAVAGGFELLLSCDLVVAAEGTQIGLPEVKRGLFAAGGGVFISRRIPLAMALEMTLTGDYLDARRAAELGLINKVVPPEDVLDEAIALADKIAANGPLAIKATKQLVRAAALGSMEDAWKLFNEWQPKVFGSADAREGALAFVERREPQWKGE